MNCTVGIEAMHIYLIVTALSLKLRAPAFKFCGPEPPFTDFGESVELYQNYAGSQNRTGSGGED